jgi:hypothetical protein
LETPSRPKSGQMTSSEVGRSESLPWRRLYEAALLEIDPAMLLRRVQEAEKAIRTRIVELRSSDANGESDQLMDALTVLNDLLRMNNIFPI